ncbi:MAG: LCP family protein [Georgenia sp.]
MDPAAPRHGRDHKRHTVRRRAGLAALALVLFVGSGAALAYSEIQGNVTRRDISDLLGDRPTAAGEPVPIDEKAGHPINLLVMGSDVRDPNTEDALVAAGILDSVEGMRSDTTMIVHVSADRSRVEIVSIPRDTLVDIPSCTMPDGAETAPRNDTIFNAAFSIGGQTGDVGAAAACTIRTVEKLTGILMDDFVVVDFVGFINMVDALDGVAMYIPDPIDDPDASITLPAGCQVLDGREALGVARARKTLGDGSDTARIGRQQELVAAIARDALGRNLLTDLPALYRFLDASTSTLTTGPYIGGLPTMAGLANSLRSIGLEEVAFATMPFEPAGARVVPAAQARAVWEALAADQPIEATLTAAGEPPAEPPAAPETPTTEPTTEAPADVAGTTDPAPEATPDDPALACSKTTAL